MRGSPLPYLTRGCSQRRRSEPSREVRRGAADGHAPCEGGEGEHTAPRNACRLPTSS